MLFVLEVIPCRVGVGQRGECEIIIFDVEVDKICQIRYINMGEQVAGQVEVAELGIVAQVDFCKAVARQGKVGELGILAQVDTCYLSGGV